MVKVFPCQYCGQGPHYSRNVVYKCRDRMRKAKSELNQKQSYTELATQKQHQQTINVHQNFIGPKQTCEFSSFKDNTIIYGHLKRSLQTEKPHQSGLLNCFKGIHRPYIRDKEFKRPQYMKHSKKYVRIILKRAALLKTVKEIFIQLIAQRCDAIVSSDFSIHHSQNDGVDIVNFPRNIMLKKAQDYFDDYCREYGQAEAFGEFTYGYYPLLEAFIKRFSYKALLRISKNPKIHVQPNTPCEILADFRAQIRRKFRQTFRTHWIYNMGARDEVSLEKDFCFLFILAWKNIESIQYIQNNLKQAKLYVLCWGFVRNVFLPAAEECRKKISNIISLPMQLKPIPLMNQYQLEPQSIFDGNVYQFRTPFYSNRISQYKYVGNPLYPGKNIQTCSERYIRSIARFTHLLNKTLVGSFEKMFNVLKSQFATLADGQAPLIKTLSGRKAWNINITQSKKMKKRGNQFIYQSLKTFTMIQMNQSTI